MQVDASGVDVLLLRSPTGNDEIAKTADGDTSDVLLELDVALKMPEAL